MYDYIIIGGGSAGCLLANRLSEDANNQVCLLESGPSDKSYWVRNCNPSNMLYLFNSKTFNWGYHAEKESRTGNRSFFWPRGRCLGGSSSINAMIYTRGHRSDYDHWATLGNNGWAYDDVLPWFKKAQRQARGESDYHGASGTMDVVDPNHHFPVSHAFVKACEEAGFAPNDDFNGATQEGCGFFQTTQTPEGERCNSSRSFLDGIEQRSNLTVITGAMVTKLIIDDKTAVGAEYQNSQKETITINANKEVILSAGVINSPQLLKLSGIGPKDELAQFNIPLVQDLPGVGENLQDHPDVMLSYFDKSRTSISMTPGPSTIDFLKGLLGFKKPFVFTPTDSGGFIKSDPSQPIPDLQLQFAPLRMRAHGKQPWSLMRFGYVLHVCHLRPESRGQVLLASNNPHDAPIIKANYFDKELELNALVNGLKIGREILNQPALQSFNNGEELPGDAVKTDEQWKQFILDHVETVYHTAGTCKMGNDDQAVVDAELKVHGVDRLRVIDSSVMPTITGSNIHGPTVMIAERGAAMILNDCTSAELNAL